jgi:hypothetical protein
VRRALAVVLLLVALGSVTNSQTSPEFLNWSATYAETIGRLAYKRGRVGGIFDTRILKTERSYNYKLAGTWLTPETIRATARVIQVRSRLSNEETLRLVEEAESVKGTVVMIEINPREGSGVIPNDWEAFLQPKDQESRAVAGQSAPKLRNVRGLAGVLERNYDYDRFWLVFPLTRADSSPLFTTTDTHAELVVRHLQQGRASRLADSPLDTLRRSAISSSGVAALDGASLLISLLTRQTTTRQRPKLEAPLGFEPGMEVLQP